MFPPGASGPAGGRIHNSRLRIGYVFPETCKMVKKDLRRSGDGIFCWWGISIQRFFVQSAGFVRWSESQQGKGILTAPVGGDNLTPEVC